MIKKLTGIALMLSLSTFTWSQDSTIKKQDWTKIDLSNRANDHFMVQVGYDNWAGATDSMNISGFSRHFNFYFFLDKPFKNNPRYSIGLGAGLGSSNIFFNDTYIDLKSTTSTLPFKDVSATNNYEKYKLTTIYFEVPLELRFASNPMQPDKGFKMAAGLKGGYLLGAYTKGKNLVDSVGNSVYGTKYKTKEYEKKFLNNTRITAIARAGYGNVTLHGYYQLTNFLDAGAGPTINPWGIGITLSGL